MYDLNPYCGEVNDFMLQVAKLDSPIQALVLPVKSKFISVFERCIVVISIFKKNKLDGDRSFWRLWQKISSGTDTLSYDQKFSWD